MTSRFLTSAVALLALLSLTSGFGAQAVPPVSVVRLPGGAVQPQLAVDRLGRTHVVYLRGPAAQSDLFYTQLSSEGRFASPIQVNSQRGSAMATGTIRGGHIAIGQKERVHVVWHGSSLAPAVGDGAPVLYTRMNDAGTGFEPERNVVSQAAGLDAGTVAADAAGHVYVIWHAGTPGSKGEAARRVWVAQSSDNGRTFASERAVSDPALGACGCCGIGAVAHRTAGVRILFRSAIDNTHRDTHLLTSRDGGERFTATKLQDWNIAACPMSSYSLAAVAGDVYAAWETDGQIYWTRLRGGQVAGSPAISRAPGVSRNRKHPAIAANVRGDVLLAWTVGTGWNKGGALAWQRFNTRGEAVGEIGGAEGVPVWSLAAAAPRPDGGFVIVY
jgi:hypothetical protein